MLAQSSVLFSMLGAILFVHVSFPFNAYELYVYVCKYVCTYMSHHLIHSRLFVHQYRELGRPTSRSTKKAAQLLLCGCCSMLTSSFRMCYYWVWNFDCCLKKLACGYDLRILFLLEISFLTSTPLTYPRRPKIVNKSWISKSFLKNYCLQIKNK